MKRLILLMITCYCLLPGHANTDIASDSLLQVLQTLPHDTTRLSTLNDIIKIEQNNYKCIQYSDTLMQEALKLKNDKKTKENLELVKKALEEGNLKEKFETLLLITSETFNNIEDEELRKAKLEEEFNKDFVAVITKEIEDISIPIVKKYFDKLVAERSDLLAIQ